MGHSQFFKMMFTSGMRETSSEKIEVHEVSGEVLEKLVEACYDPRKVKISNVTELFELILAADRFDMPQHRTWFLEILERLNLEKCVGDTLENRKIFGEFLKCLDIFTRESDILSVLNLIVYNWKYFDNTKTEELILPYLSHFKIFKI